MAVFRKGTFDIRTNQGEQAVKGWIASNGLAIQGEGSGRRGHYTITHVASGLAFNSMSFTNLSDAKQFVSDLDGVAPFHAKDFRPKTDDLKKIRAAYVRVRPEMKSREEREQEERAHKEQEQRKREQERQSRQDYGHFDYRGSGYTKKGRYVKLEKLNKYDINAQNRKGQRIAHAEATGSRAMHQARHRIWSEKHTWLKFATYNRTRGKFLKG